jgi:hypothetical protein
MLDRPGNPFALSGMQVAAAVSLMLTIAAGPAWPQGAAPPSAPGVQNPARQAAPQQSEPAPSPAPQAREEHPGLLNEMGKLFEKSWSILPPLKSPGETIDDLNARAKEAGDPVAAGKAILHGGGPHDLSRFNHRRGGLQGRRR